jgi:two-component system, chemotaxis family, chemotaxis protein CheY
MSDFDDAPSTGALFEALDELEAGFLSMEQEGDQARALVHGLFRVAHNLKSTLSMAGQGQASALMHDIEACLDEVRSNALEPDSCLADAFLAGVDAVKMALASAAGAEAKMQDAATALQASAKGKKTQIHLKPVDLLFPLDADAGSAASAATAAGKRLYVIEKAVGAGLRPEDAVELPVFDTLKSLGTILAWQLDQSEGTGLLRLVISSTYSTEEVGDCLFDPFIEAGPPTQSKALTATQATAQAQTSIQVEAQTSDLAPAQPNRSVEQAPGLEVTEPVPEPLKGSLSAKANTAAASTPLRVLIVDDDPLSVHILQAFVASYALSDAAVNGTEALEKFRSALSSHTYDIVFLDIVMDDMQGFEVLSAMRKMEADRGILLAEGARIIMTSSLSDYSSVSSAFRNSCDAYLIKPVSRAKVVEALDELGVRNQIAKLPL